MAARKQQRPKGNTTTQSRSPIDPLWLDLKNKSVWKGAERLELRPREFAVLHCLMDHAGELVTKDALYEVVWQAENVVVGDDALTTCIYEIRQVLGEKTKNPHYIETRHKYGYRFIGPIVTDPQLVSSPQFQSSKAPPRPVPGIQYATPALVGREAELEQLHRWLEKALDGERQIVFISGESGIGKTTVVRAFLRQIAASGNIAIGRGQCIEHYGPGEAYLPVLEAVGRLCRDPRGAFLVEWMKQYAPTWLLQIPALLSATDREDLQYKVQGTMQQRMLREMSEGIELLTQQFPCILVLEDLQWSDASTLDLLASAARRQERARLLVIGTYRPEEALTEGHPLRAVTQELRGHGLCQDLVLTPLSEAAVEEYVERRFPLSALPTRLPRVLHRVTGGNPLFLVAVVDDLIERKVIVQADGSWMFQRGLDEVAAGAPENIRQLIGKQIDRLKAEERRLLQAASIAGFEFSAAAVAAAVGVSVAEVEERCEVLAQQQRFLRPAGYTEWPDGTQSARYRFHHALYQYLWNERVTPHQRPQLHQKIGERLEIAYGNRAGEIAAEIALHFEQGQDYKRAVQYLQQAAQNALRRSANKEALAYSLKGLELLKTLPENPERTQRELALQITLGIPLLMTRGHTNPEVERVYARARELCSQVGEVPHLLQVLYGLRRFYFVKGEMRTAHELGEQIFSMVQRLREPLLLMWGHYLVGDTLYYAGKLISAQKHLEQGVAFDAPLDHRSWVFLYGYDQKMGGLSCLARTLWMCGYPDQARKRNLEASNQARKTAHPFSLANSLVYSAVVHQFCQEPRAVQEQAEAAVTLSREQGFPFFEAWGCILRGWALAIQDQVEEALCQMQQGFTVLQATGAEIAKPYTLSLLAEAYGRAGQAEAGLETIANALALGDKNGDHVREAELYRLKGELTLQKFQASGSQLRVSENQRVKNKLQKAKIPTFPPLLLPPQAEAEAEACFHKALAIAREQSAKSLELRAVMSLAQLWRQQGKKTSARKMLTEIYGWFTEGFDTVDLQQAKALLEEFGR
jgi:DNA-binding winged helix-turn-helix (wHTH) protein/predicted ATPase